MQTPYVAHALGAFKGQAYLNCLECFHESYARGIRYFEADLWLTPSGEGVVFHDGLEKEYGLKAGFQRAEFLRTRPRGATPLDFSGLVRLLKDHPDTFVVTDAKNGNARALSVLSQECDRAGVNYRERILPQIYTPDEFDSIHAMGFRRILFTLYLYGFRRGPISNALRDYPIAGLVMPAGRVDWQFIANAHGAGVPVYAHTLNDPAAAKSLFQKGVSGIYTDTLP